VNHNTRAVEVPAIARLFAGGSIPHGVCKGATLSSRPRSPSGIGPICLAALIAMSADAMAQTAPEATSPALDIFRTQSAVTKKPASNFDPIQVPSGGRPLTIAHIKDIPRQLNAAILHSRCRLTNDLLAHNPVLIFRPADGYRVMALVPCQATTPESRAFQFERSIAAEPTPMTFPVAAPAGGISATYRPGRMTWNPRRMTLTAWRGNGACPAHEMRHTYRQGSGELNGFALTRIEQRQHPCNAPEPEWQTLWRAPAWNLRR
jgi:hypothetical protein